MIRINLLGRARPKPQRQAVPLEATLQVVFFLAAMVVAFGVLYYNWHSTNEQITEVRLHIQKQSGEKARLEKLKMQVDEFERQKGVLQQRINIIEELQRNRTGGQELLNALADTVVRTDTLWLTSLNRQGNGLTIIGTAGSINAVANFITQLKHSGYFDQIEIKESTQDTKNSDIQTFAFILTAQFALPQDKPAGTSPAAAPASAPGSAPASVPARKS